MGNNGVRGKTLKNRYVVKDDDPIKTGGMSSIYKGSDIEEHIPVAVKEFSSEVYDDDIILRSFNIEVRAYKDLKHPNILRVLDYEDPSSTRDLKSCDPYLVLDLKEHNLREHKKKHPGDFSSWQTFFEGIARPLLNAISLAHKKNVSHRDIKPENVLIKNNIPFLADFGIAKIKRDLNPGKTLNTFCSPPFTPLEAGTHYDEKDVQAFAVLCIWCLAKEGEVTKDSERSDIYAALNGLDIPDDIKNIFIKCISKEPEDRYSTACSLETELVAAHEKHVGKDHADSLPKIELVLTINVKTKVAEHVNCLQTDKYKIEEFVNLDLSISPLVEKDEDTYLVHGESCTYRLAPDKFGEDKFILIDVLFYSNPERLTRRRENKPIMPIRLLIDPYSEFMDIDDATDAIEDAIDNYGKGESAYRDEPDALLRKLDRLLEAKQQYLDESLPEVSFTSSQVNGSLLEVTSETNIENLVLGSEFEFFGTREGKQPNIRLSLFKQKGNKLTFKTKNRARQKTPDLHSIPENGSAKQRDPGSYSSTRKQREGLEKLNSGGSSRCDLRELLAKPQLSMTVKENPSLQSDLKSRYHLDDGQSKALDIALQSEDFTVVHGPPGTGKTRFISALILETLRQNPNARILLTSQTHAAIDNALERIHESDQNIKMLRLISNNDERAQTHKKLSSISQEFLYQKQLPLWRKEIESRCVSFLEQFADSEGENLSSIDLHLRLSRLVVLRSNSTKKPPKKQTIKTLEDSIIKDYPEQSDCIKLSTTALENFIKEHNPTSPQADFIRQLYKLQSDWIKRVGTPEEAFVQAKCESSQVVAATCLGFSSLPGTENLEYDLCIMDEAGKAQSTEAILPLLNCNKWILVGDNKQLRPFKDEVLYDDVFVTNFELDDEELVEPMFDRLTRMLPKKNVCYLDNQYRMVAPIGNLISNCFYDGKLKTARTVDANRYLSNTFKDKNGNPTHAIWFSTEHLSNREEAQPKNGKSRMNPCEANVIIDLLRQIEDSMIGSDEKVSVLCLSGYDAQREYLKKRINPERFNLKHLNIMIENIDAVQGRESDVLIFSVTRSNNKKQVGHMKDLRRVNVACSRAKDLLLIVGDAKFIRNHASQADHLYKILNELGSTNGCDLRFCEET